MRVVRVFVSVVALIAAAASVATPRDAQLAARGERVFYEQGCHGCHRIGKVGSGGIAADLSGIGAKRSRADLFQWLRDPAAQKPTAHMPRIALPEADAQALAAYLASLR
jgi:mono/diheme cytochrome c family protein